MSDAPAKTPRRPLPKLDELDTQAFWQATANEQLTYQQCNNCNTIVWYPRAHCTGCTSGELVSKVASGRGTVYTFSIVRLSYHPFFRAQAPYAVAWIDLDEGPRILSNVIGLDDPATDLQIGDAVALVWEHHDELKIPLFEKRAS
ncbi:MAG: Zn-ribbon domain-containing OB-fold protein [Pseudomonadales bacterium]